MNLGEFDDFKRPNHDKEFKIDPASDPSKCLFEHEEYYGAIFSSDKNPLNDDNTDTNDSDLENLV